MSAHGGGGATEGNDPDGVQLPSGEWTTVVSQGPSPAVQSTMDQMTNQLQTVIDAAERAAQVIRHDAEEQARRHLAEAQAKADQMTAERVRLIAALTDDLVRHAGTVRAKSEEMVGALEEAIGEVTRKLDEPVEALVAHSSAPDGAPEPVAAGPEDGPGGLPPATGHEHPGLPLGSGGWALHGPESPAIPQDALLEATRLAVAGTDRASIAAILRADYGIDDPDPVVDRVLGPA
jgi:hypothetical protein